jgi:acetylornithine aminotransferase
MSNSIMNTYGRMDVCFSHGEGVWLWDDKGSKYFDALCGIAVTGLGHAHPNVSKAICEQANKLLHTSNLYQIAAQQQLADKLTSISTMDRVFFSNSGAEANEAMIKIARLFGSNKGISKPAMVVMEHSFHGRTLATLSATGNRKVQAGFEPLVSGFVRAPYDDIEALNTIAKNNSNVVAVMVEPVQGEGGVHIPKVGYLKAIRELCDKNGWLMMLDEVQTGMGRTGQWFAHQHEGIVPDVMSLAKSLGNGVPIGACLAKGIAAETLVPGTHGSTFGGNPLVCAAAVAVIDAIEKDNLVARAEHLGALINTQLIEKCAAIEAVVSIRNKGLMIGVELDRPCTELVGIALKEGLLINVTANSVIRLLPPLVMSDDDANQLVDRIVALIKAFV